MKNTKYTALAAFTTIALTATSFSAVLGEYTFTDSLAASSVNSDLIFSNITLGSGFTETYADISSDRVLGGADGGAFYDVTDGTTSNFLGNSISSGYYISFNIDLSSTYEATGGTAFLQSINFSYQSNSDTNAFDRIGLAIDLDSNGLDTGDQIDNWNISSVGSLNEYTFSNINQEVTAAGLDVYFVFSGKTNASDLNSESYFGNIEIVGTPEPTSAALLGLGGLAILARRRR